MSPSATLAATAITDAVSESIAVEAMPEANVDLRDESVELEALLVSRAYLYMLFHKLLGASPNGELFEILLSEVTARVVDEYAQDNATMQGLGLFLAELAGSDDRKALLDAARDEYTRLFIGPGVLPALPWESPYRSNEPTVFQENTLAVRAEYRAHGLEPRQLLRVPDDHVALECAFMAQGAEASLDALKKGNLNELAKELRDQQRFVHDHIGVWLNDFAQRVRTSKTAVLYPQMIEALAAFAELDAVFLAEASFWAEETGGLEVSDVGILPDTPESEALDQVKRTQKALSAVHPFGLEDYELCVITYK